VLLLGSILLRSRRNRHYRGLRSFDSVYGQLDASVDALSAHLYRCWPMSPVSSKSSPASGKTPKQPTRPSDMLDPVRVSKTHSSAGTWTEYLVLFLRLMAAVSLVKGLYHWTQVCGIGAGVDEGFEAHTVAWQAATVFFAVLDLVAAVGLWLAAAWGAVVWLGSVVSMAVVVTFFPNVFGASIVIVFIEMTLLAVYLWLAIMSARERPA
jgi:hypothetical protein